MSDRSSFTGCPIRADRDQPPDNEHLRVVLVRRTPRWLGRCYRQPFFGWVLTRMDYQERLGGDLLLMFWQSTEEYSGPNWRDYGDPPIPIVRMIVLLARSVPYAIYVKKTATEMAAWLQGRLGKGLAVPDFWEPTSG